MRAKMEKLGKELEKLTGGKLRLMDHAVLDGEWEQDGYRYFLISEIGKEEYMYKTQRDTIIALEEMIEDIKMRKEA